MIHLCSIRRRVLYMVCDVIFTYQIPIFSSCNDPITAKTWEKVKGKNQERESQVLEYKYDKAFAEGAFSVFSPWRPISLMGVGIYNSFAEK